MKKIFFMGVMGMFLLGSCSSHSGHNHEEHDHEGHNHATEEHAHNHEGHSHESHDHEGHNHGEEGHNHAHEGHNHAEEVHKHEAHAQEGHNHDAHAHEGHSHDAHDHGHDHGSNPDEIILAPHKAKAAGVASMEIQPKSFRQVIKASGEVQAAQGNESTIVANVAGVVSFQRSVTEGMQVGKGATIMTISASKLQDGDPPNVPASLMKQPRRISTVPVVW